jgi:chorismate mutase
VQNNVVSRAIRGAITVNSNTADEISSATVKLLTSIMESNEINEEDIVSVIFTLTNDLTAEFPAKSARIHLGWTDVPMICTGEIPVQGSLQMCIRVMITFNTARTRNEIRHVYLGGATALRPDLANQ